MEAGMDPGPPLDDGRLARVRLGLNRMAARWLSLRLSVRRSPSVGGRATRTIPPFVAAAVVVAAAVTFVAVLTWYGAREFSGRATDTRASNEAMSFAEHSSRLATGDAFDGYIQILRFADDPAVNSKVSTPDQRLSAMQQLLYLNVNKFTSLTIADRSGIILATTDPSISSVRESTVFIETRADLGTANSDIILPQAGQHGFIEYSAGLRDPADGTLWAILIGRADPAVVWRETLLAAVDGSRNVIINNEGQFAAGVPDELLRLPWHGHPLPNGAVRADIAGVDSICGLAPIGRDTQIDRGLSVASCLPASIIQAERELATGKQLLVTAAGSVLAVVVAGAALYMILGSRLAPSPVDAGVTLDPIDAHDATEGRETPIPDASPEVSPIAPGSSHIVEDPSDEATADVVPDPDPVPDNVVAFERSLPPPPDIDALQLIDAYEERNARLAERLRESVQARLLIATTRADEAYRLATTDDELAAGLHTMAMAELGRLQEHEIRAISQELFPGLVRMGLPAALRALQKDVIDLIDVRLDVDASCDAVDGGPGRAALPAALRMVLYRCVADATRLLMLAGAPSASVSLHRVDGHLVIRIWSPASEIEGEVEDATLAASALAIEAWAGSLHLRHDHGRVTVEAEVPAPAIAAVPVDMLAFETAVEHIGVGAEGEHEGEECEGSAAQLEPVASASNESEGEVPLNAIAADLPAELRIDEDDLAGALEGLQASMFGALVVSLDVSALRDGVSELSISADVSRLVIDMVGDTLRSLESAHVRHCSVSVDSDAGKLLVNIASDAAQEFKGDAIAVHAPSIDAMGGRLEVSQSDGSLSITAEFAVDDDAAPDRAASADDVA